MHLKIVKLGCCSNLAKSFILKIQIEKYAY